MKAVAISAFIFVAPLLAGAEHALGPVTLKLPDEVHVEASKDVLLAFIGGEPGNPRAHFNIQTAELAKIRSGEISVPAGFGDLSRVLRKKKKTSTVSPNGHQLKGIEGRMTVEGKEAFAFAVVLTGKDYRVYFALVDWRGPDEARKLYDEILGQIDRCRI